ncbi:hypothetical protein AWB69_00745 [Caballeronia udeis]|uniref:Uncharacterized protein n=1 Tax=Caballeronia udeis TaxID=1232866 RepID=A0A158F7G6_9BURK|nr:hypothetical protein [Caballeronia udeis]SAL15593.1 hypothetical protein AWB69_00745 [Caballeronia udeis]
MTNDRAVHTQACSLLESAVNAQRQQLKVYERPSEPLAFETVRAIDYVFCRELFPESEECDDSDSRETTIMSWGVNGALSRILPDHLHGEPFKLFPSTAETQAKADSFLFNCGVLALAERQAELLKDGLLSASVDPRRVNQTGILALSTSDTSLYSEEVGHAGAHWSSAQATIADRTEEAALEERHRSLLPVLERQLSVSHGWSMSYGTSPEIDRYFHDWAELYLRRMPYRDMVSDGDTIGGRNFSDYVQILKALSAMGQMRLCYTGLLKHRHPKLDFRNMLTGFSFFDDLLVSIATFLDADTLEVQRLLSHLMLEPANKALHLERSDTAWAPVMRTSVGACLLPAYGLDINPFLFLLNDLRKKYEKDWFRIANEREARWIAELELLFPTPRWQSTRRGVKLRRGTQVVTDVDFATYDSATGEIALCQMKWQQPVAADQKIRRSTGRNLLDESNRWISEVRKWIEEFGEGELGRRLGFQISHTLKLRLFVLARYGAHFSGYGGRDESAVWTDWGHFQKVRLQNIHASVVELAEQLSAEIESVRSEIQPERLVLPLPGLAVVVNPTAVPRHVRPVSEVDSRDGVHE